jgi:hypothetical protein
MRGKVRGAFFGHEPKLDREAFEVLSLPGGQRMMVLGVQHVSGKNLAGGEGMQHAIRTRVSGDKAELGLAQIVEANTGAKVDRGDDERLARGDGRQSARSGLVDDQNELIASV